MNLVPNTKLLLNVPFNKPNVETKYCVWTTKYKRLLEMSTYCPTCRNEKGVYISNNKTTSFYDCEKCKACCHVLNIPFMDQKLTLMLFSGDGTQCLPRKTSRHYEKKPSPFLQKFLHLSQPSTSEPEPKKAEVMPFVA